MPQTLKLLFTLIANHILTQTLLQVQYCAAKRIVGELMLSYNFVKQYVIYEPSLPQYT